MTQNPLIFRLEYPETTVNCLCNYPLVEHVLRLSVGLNEQNAHISLFLAQLSLMNQSSVSEQTNNLELEIHSRTGDLHRIGKANSSLRSLRNSVWTSTESVCIVGALNTVKCDLTKLTTVSFIF